MKFRRPNSPQPNIYKTGNTIKICQEPGIHSSVSDGSLGGAVIKTAAHRERLNFNKVPTTAFVNDDVAILDNALRNLSTKSISVYEALRPALATDHILINCILLASNRGPSDIDWRRLISEADDECVYKWGVKIF